MRQTIWWTITSLPCHTITTDTYNREFSVWMHSFSCFETILKSIATSESLSTSYIVRGFFLCRVVLERPYWRHWELLSEVKKLGLEEISSFANNLLSNINLLCFAHGNVNQSKVSVRLSVKRQFRKNSATFTKLWNLSLSLSRLSITPTPLSHLSLLNWLRPSQWVSSWDDVLSCLLEQTTVSLFLLWTLKMWTQL